jgi:hypothetical protein
MITAILAGITGILNPLQFITGKITDLLALRAKVKGDAEIKEIDRQIMEAQDRRMVLVAEAQHKVVAAINACFRGLITLAPAGILLKLMLWDKVVGSFAGCAGLTPREFDMLYEQCKTFRTDPLDAYQWGVITAVIAFYFGYSLINSKK